MHICPQEIMAVMQAVEILRPAIGILQLWCQSCFDGTHKSCADHAEAVAKTKCELTHEPT